MAVNEFAIRDIWYNWQVPIYVSLGLCSQIILLLLGCRRKYQVNIWFKFLLWSAYLGEISVAISALGYLGNKLFYFPTEHSDDDDNKYTVQALWPPFLLLYLGGPVTITAYSTEDNEFWLRYLLGFIFHIGAATNCLRLTWKYKIYLAYIALPIYFTGIIKYGERIYVLWSSSRERFKETLFSNPNPYPDLVKINKQDMEERLQGDKDIEKEMLGESHQLFQAFFLFKRFANLFAGFTLHSNEAKIGYEIIRKRSAKDAFDLVAIELSIMYDVLYTKAIVVYSKAGIFLRLISFSSSISTLVAFTVFCKSGACNVFLKSGPNCNVYPSRDVVITYLLLVITIVIEVYEVVLTFCSDWAKIIRLSLSKNAKHVVSDSKKRKRWSEAMGQLNLISCCLKDLSDSCIGLQKLYCVNKSLKYYLYMTREDVSVELQNFIFKELSQKIEINKLENHFGNNYLCKKVLAKRGDYVLKERHKISGFEWCTIEMDFDRSLLLWHIATDLFYHADLDKHGGSASSLQPNCKISKCLSDYMLYLLVLCPYMMPKVVDELMFTNIYAQAMKFFESPDNSKFISGKTEACKILLAADYLSEEDMPLLVEGCKLAKQLQKLESNSDPGSEKWSIISELWVEMLTHAANECVWIEHGYRITKGGELLTHVALLMAHLGLCEQYHKDGKKIDR